MTDAVAHQVGFPHINRELGLWRWVLALLLLLIACPAPARQDGQAEDAAGHDSIQDSRDRYDLLADEHLGGHTIRKHVGKTDDDLRERLHRERDISAASTWTDLVVAEETVAEAVQANDRSIKRWRERGGRRANLALHYLARRVIGRSIAQGAFHSDPCTRAVIVLRARDQSFFVLTAYPEAR